MGHIPLAFSVHNFVNSVGADAGFASIIGLAILVLLYFAQARETATLREQLEQSAMRVQQLEGRLAHPSRQAAAAAQQTTPPMQAASPSAGATPAAPAPAAAGAAATTPAPATPAAAASAGAATTPPSGRAQLPPAGVGAPPLTAATRLIPSGSSPETEAAATPPATPSPPATGNGTGEHAAVPPPPPQPPPIRRLQSGSARGPARTTTSGARASGRGQKPGLAARAMFPVLVVLGLAAVVVILLVLTSGGGSTKRTATAGTPTSNAPSARQNAAKPFNNATVTVAVLNGTATPGLAGKTATRLTSAGFKKGTIATATDQTRTATVVAYLPGHHNDALQVARNLKLGPASVQPIDKGTQAVACPPPAPCAPTVVVTVGADLKLQ